MHVTKKQKIFGFIRILRPEITTLGMICVYVGAAISMGSYFFSFKLFLAMISVFLIASGSSPFNDYFDYEIDKIAHPNHVLNLGILKRETALYTGIVFFSAGLVLAFFINPVVFLLTIIGVTLICLYELVSKNQGFIGNIVVAFTTALSFNLGGAVVGNLLEPTFVALIAFFLFLAREIMLDVRDYEGDLLNRVSLPVIIGRKNAAYFACILLGFSLFLFVLPVFLGVFSIWYLLLSIPVIFVGGWAVVLPLIDVEYVSRSTDVLRFTMLQGLIVFIFIPFL